MSGTRNPLLGDWFQPPTDETANPLMRKPTYADAAQWHGQNLADTWTAMQNPQTWADAASQYGNALLMGTTTPGAPRVQFDWTPGGGTKTAQIGKTELTYGIDRTGETGEVILVQTPKEARGQGEARRAMEQFLAHSDGQGTTLFLNADPMDKGVTKGGLERFYRSLGFVKNMGRNKDFRSTAEYVRQPPEQ